MIRQLFRDDMPIDAHGFRVRGREVTRVEALSDAVFGFAITLLVVSLEVPRTYAELVRLLNGFAAFGVTFVMLLMIWYEHYVFFRRYALQDFHTIILNSVLLFTVVFYIYPLKFMFTSLLGGPGEAVVESPGQAISLMILYGVSIIIVYGVFVLMYVHAWRKRHKLGLDEREIYLTFTKIRYAAIWVGVALTSITIAWLGGTEWLRLAGMTYATLGPLQGANGYWSAAHAPKREALANEEPVGATPAAT